MTSICPKCGLPSDLCVCESIAKESQKIVINLIKKKFGKLYTTVEGIDAKEINMKDLAKKLKNEFACGGTIKDSIIELQGNHQQGMKKFLVEMGFAPETINIVANEDAKKKRR
jgi:translation initiation factor 1